MAIAGCGPAGLAAALILERQGHRIDLLERFATPAAVGSGLMLQPTGLRVLEQLGLLPRILAAGQRIDRIHGRAMPAGRTVLDVTYDALGPGMYGLALQRSDLFDILYEAVLGTSVALHTDVDARRLQQAPGGAVVTDAAGIEHGPYDLVVDATGAGSAVRDHEFSSGGRRLLDYGALWGKFALPQDGFAPNQLSQRYVAAHTMVGVLPTGGDQLAFFWSLRRDALDDWRARGLDRWKQQVTALWPETALILEQIIDPSQMTFASYGHHTLRRPGGTRLAVIGDAAHATSPQLGQGANMALLDAWALGLAIREHDDTATAIAHYSALRRWHVRLFQLASYTLTGFYQSDSRTLAALRDRLFAPLSRAPGFRHIVAGLVSGLLGNPLQRLGFDQSRH